MSMNPQVTNPVHNMAEVNKLLEEVTRKLVEANSEIECLKTELAKMRKLSCPRWLSAKFRNIGRAACGGTVHSITMEVYDNGRLVLNREIDAYETKSGRADDFYVAGRMNAFVSDFYGTMRRAEKERARLVRKGAL